jgi:hypothetical protein
MKSAKSKEAPWVRTAQAVEPPLHVARHKAGDERVLHQLHNPLVSVKRQMIHSSTFSTAQNQFLT